MAWGTFFGAVIGAYAIYYVLNILYDLFFSRNHKAAAQSSVHYNLGDLASDDEQPCLVTDEVDQQEPDYDDQDYDEEEYEDDYDDAQEMGYAAEPEQEPALKVEGQGIPLDDFLKEAHSYSKTIF